MTALDGDIPLTIEAIGPAWLTQVLGNHLPGVEVSEVEVLGRHAGTTGRARLGLTYIGDINGPSTIFVKLPPFDDAQRAMVAFTDMGRREARFYAEVANRIPIRIPHPFHAAYGESAHEYIMLLEDLEASGCNFPRIDDETAPERAGEVIDALARLHAHFWNDPCFRDSLSWVEPPMRHEIGTSLVAQAIERFSDDFPPIYTALGRLFVDHHDAVCDLWDEGEETLVHGDCHAGNQFVDGGRVGLYDWAVLSRAPGMRDVANFLCHSVQTDLRMTQQESLIRRYREGLVAGGVDAPAEDTLWKRYRRAVLYGWVAASTTAAMGGKWQPVAVGMAGMRRSTQACTDLETLDAFREDL